MGPTSMNTHHTSITKINQFMMFRKISVYFENQMKHINTLSELNVELMIVKAGGTHSYQ